MTTLTSIAIPVVPRSESRDFEREDSSSSPPYQTYTPRTYDNKPLPLALSYKAPRNARIVSREIGREGVNYTLKIGEIEINNVGVEELLDYVSPYHLEQYENRAFEEERAVIRAAEEAAEERRREKAERRRERATRKGIAGYRDPDTGLVLSLAGRGESTDAGEFAVGRHGRARPTYKHLYLKARERKKRRKRDPDTGELLARSDGSDVEVDDAHIGSSESSADGDRATGPSMDAGEPKKRRRRRRDPITNELLPLPSVKAPPVSVGESMMGKKKHKRRRRHPITNELMPLGWHYDPDSPGARGPVMASSARQTELAVPSLRKLSISQEHDHKRRKLASGASSSSRRSGSPVIILPASPETRRNPRARGQAATRIAAVPLGTSTSDRSEEDRPGSSSAAPEPMLKPQPKPVRRSVGGAPIMQAAAAVHSTATSIAPDSSPDESEQESDDDANSEPTNTMTSILKPAATSTHHTRSTTEDSGSSIEPLQANSPEHNIFRPHAAQQATPKAKSSLTAPIATPRGPSSLMAPTAHATEPSSATESDSEPGEGEYFVEAMLAHHWSDPRTHPPHLGKKRTMLYQVKWEGYAEPTWEPADSFGDPEVVGGYARRVGLPLGRDGQVLDEDNEMEG